MNHAKLSESPRLQKLLKALESAGSDGATTLDLIRVTGLCAINSAISELRRNGITIYCRNEGRTADGAQVYRYKLAPAAPGAASGFPAEALDLCREMVAIRPVRGQVWTVDKMKEWNRLWDQFTTLVPDVKQQDDLYLSVQK